MRSLRPSLPPRHLHYAAGGDTSRSRRSPTRWIAAPAELSGGQRRLPAHGFFISRRDPVAGRTATIRPPNLERSTVHRMPPGSEGCALEHVEPDTDFPRPEESVGRAAVTWVRRGAGGDVFVGRRRKLKRRARQTSQRDGTRHRHEDLKRADGRRRPFGLVVVAPSGARRALGRGRRRRPSGVGQPRPPGTFSRAWSTDSGGGRRAGWGLLDLVRCSPTSPAGRTGRVGFAGDASDVQRSDLYEAESGRGGRCCWCEAAV